MKRSPESKPSVSINPGDIFVLGEHRLACGDAKNKALVDRLIDTSSIDLILTDPPYGVNYVGSKKGISEGILKPKEILNDHEQSDEEYALFTQDWLSIVKAYLSRKNAVYIFNSDKMIFPLREGMRAEGFKFAQLLIWAKTHSVIGRLDYLPQHELIAYGWHGKHAFY
jgi:DNA modification methylase